MLRLNLEYFYYSILQTMIENHIVALDAMRFLYDVVSVCFVSRRIETTLPRVREEILAGGVISHSHVSYKKEE